MLCKFLCLNEDVWINIPCLREASCSFLMAEASSVLCSGASASISPNGSLLGLSGRHLLNQRNTMNVISCVSWTNALFPSHAHTHHHCHYSPLPPNVMWYLEVLRDRFHFLILVSGSCPVSSHFEEIKMSSWTLWFLSNSMKTGTTSHCLFFGFDAVYSFCIYPNKRIGWPTLMLHWLKEFFLKRISNRIGGSPDQLLMKCVRLGGSAVFKGVHTKY